MSDDTVGFILGCVSAACLCAAGLLTWIGRRKERVPNYGLSFWLEDPSEDEGEPFEPPYRPHTALGAA